MNFYQHKQQRTDLDGAPSPVSPKRLHVPHWPPYRVGVKRPRQLFRGTHFRDGVRGSQDSEAVNSQVGNGKLLPRPSVFRRDLFLGNSSLRLLPTRTWPYPLPSSDVSPLSHPPELYPLLVRPRYPTLSFPSFYS